MLRTLTYVLTFALAAVAHAATSPSEVVRNAIEQFRAGDILRADVIVSDLEDLRAATYVYRGSLIAKLDETTGLTTFRYDARITGNNIPRGARFTMTADGTEAQLLAYTNKTEYRTPIEAIAQDKNFTPVVPVVTLINALLAPNQDLDSYADLSEAQLRTAREGRDECQVLTVGHEGGTIELYLAQSNNLPVRLDVSAPESGKVVMRINKLRLNTQAPDSTFTIRPAPRGFSIDKGDTDEPSTDGTPSAGASPVGLDVGDLAPNFTLMDKDGKPHSLEDYRGRVVLIDFWGVWCHWCKVAMPGLQQMHRELKDEGLTIMGVNVGDKSSDIPIKYMRSHGYDYLLLLEGRPVAERYNVRGFPTFYVIDTEGKVLYEGSGYSKQQERRVENVIREELGLEPKPEVQGRTDPDDPDEFEDY